jgi:hypothetical protein
MNKTGTEKAKDPIGSRTFVRSKMESIALTVFRDINATLYVRVCFCD